MGPHCPERDDTARHAAAADPVADPHKRRWLTSVVTARQRRRRACEPLKRVRLWVAVVLCAPVSVTAVATGRGLLAAAVLVRRWRGEDRWRRSLTLALGSHGPAACKCVPATAAYTGRSEVCSDGYGRFRLRIVMRGGAQSPSSRVVVGLYAHADERESPHRPPASSRYKREG